MTGGQKSGKGRIDKVLLNNPRWVNAVFSSPDWAWLWLIVRLWLGVSWIEAGWHKTREAAWTGGGMAVKGYWERAIVIPEQGRSPIAYDWYRQFLEFLLRNEWYDVVGWLVAYGEVLVGLGLIVGAFTGLAAFFGALMNWNFMLAGTASTNPVLGLIALGVMVAWKTAGWWGLDRLLLPAFGAPWQRGALLGGVPASVAEEAPAREVWYAEQWVRMLVAAAVAVFAFAALEDALQLLVSGLAVLLAAVSGTGKYFFSRREPHDHRQ